MRIFICYSGEHENFAERLGQALRNAGHEPFVAGKALRTSDEYNTRIRQEIRKSDRFIFLITLESIKSDSYTLTELHFAEEKWPRPEGRVLPINIGNVPYERLPAYPGTTAPRPVGDPIAFIVGEVSKQHRTHSRIVPAALALALALGVALWSVFLFRSQHIEILRGDGAVIPSGQFQSVFSARVVNGFGRPVVGAKVAWRASGNAERAFIGETDSAGVSTVTNMQTVPGSASLEQTAAIVSRRTPPGFTNTVVNNAGASVTFRYYVLPRRS